MFAGCRLKRRGLKGLRTSRASLPGVGMCRALPAGFVFRRSSVSVSIVTRTTTRVELSRAGALGASAIRFRRA